MIRHVFILFWLAVAVSPVHAALNAAVVQQLAAPDTDQKISAIQQLALSAEPEAMRLLQALADDSLLLAGDKLVRIDGQRAFDAATSVEISPVPVNTESLVVNNRARGELATALAVLKLFGPNRDERLAAAKALEDNVDPIFIPVLERALAQEQDAEVKKMVAQAHALMALKSPDPAQRLAAVKTLGESGNPNLKIQFVALTSPANEADEQVRMAAQISLRALETRLAWGENISRIFSGLSLGSVLLLAALGLAITYGVMGIINMAHGELLMVGAYATYSVQNVFRNHFPDALDWYVLAAIPVAFFSAALVGVIMERTVIRWLYGRPLETLLATWGLSLILIQAARVIFGPQNMEVANPSWMSGGVELISNVVLPWNRLIIIGFALFVLGLMWVLLNRTRLGLFVRAVTQNRAMAGCVGVPTGRIDTLAFALGAGIAGLGGVALSQIANVGPDMGQGYIVDSFMVVVLGGVGQLAGAVWAALGLGVVTKFIEGWAGAVIAKIVVLVFIIIIIQKRPQGLFALKGRSVD